MASGFAPGGGHPYSGYSLGPLASASSWAPVRAATTANITLAGGAPNTTDGVALAAGDRILVKNQAAPAENGIYTVTTLGTGVNGTWTRALDASVSSDFVDGKTVAVGEGTLYADTLWEFITNAPFVLGVTAVTFVQITPATTVTGWTRDAGPPATVRLTTATDQLAVGTATPATGRKATFLTTGVNQGIRVNTTAVTDNALDVFNLAEANATWAMTGLGTMTWGPGGATAVDTRLRRSGVKTLTLDDTAGGSATFLPGADNVGAIGTSTVRWATNVANAHQVFGVSADANPTVSITTSTIKMGLNTADNLSTRLFVSANKTFSIDDGAAGIATLRIVGQTTTMKRTLQVHISADANYTIDSNANTPDDFVGMTIVATNRTCTMPTATDGRRLILANTAVNTVVANTATFTRAGTDQFNTSTGLQNSISLTGAQSVTVVAASGKWYLV